MTLTSVEEAASFADDEVAATGAEGVSASFNKSCNTETRRSRNIRYIFVAPNSLTPMISSQAKPYCFKASLRSFKISSVEAVFLARDSAITPSK